MRSAVGILCLHYERITFLALIFYLARFSLEVLCVLRHCHFLSGLFFVVTTIRNWDGIRRILTLTLIGDDNGLSEGLSGHASRGVAWKCIRLYLARLPGTLVDCLITFVCTLICHADEKLTRALSLVESVLTSFRERRLQIDIVKLLFQALNSLRSLLSLCRRQIELRGQLLDLVLSTTSPCAQLCLWDLPQDRQRVLLLFQ